MRLADFKVLTFDTFGTLIDWESGIVAALRPLVARVAEPPERDGVLEAFGRREAEQQAATPDMKYSDLLAAVFRTLAADWQVAVTDEEALAFGRSVGDWPAFPDSAPALAYLKRHYRLVTLTNCDRESYRGAGTRLGDPWDAVYTAEEIGSYKPDIRNFEYLLARVREEFGAEKDDILHVAQSLFHDHVPAKRIGLATAWIDRRHDAVGPGATPPAAGARWDFRFESMAALVEAHRRQAEA